VAARKKGNVVSAEKVVIPPMDIAEVVLTITGTAPLVSNAFSSEVQGKVGDIMSETAEQKRIRLADEKKNGRAPKDFQKEYMGSLHKDVATGKLGINAMAVKSAMVRASKTVGVNMVDAKMYFSVVGDGFNKEGQPLFFFTKGTPRMVQHHVRNAGGGPDIRARAMFDSGWQVQVRIQYHQDLIQLEHIINLLARAGAQVGVGAGRPCSTNSVGMGWGTFKVETQRVSKKVA
jgi:hypothetical protein